MCGCDWLHMAQKNHPQKIVTTQPVEWLSIKDAARLFGLGRSSIYTLIGEERIRSCSLRLRGNVRGKRLISAESLRMFLESGGEG